MGLPVTAWRDDPSVNVVIDTKVVKNITMYKLLKQIIPWFINIKGIFRLKIECIIIIKGYKI
jgi:hypothetical protein